MCNYCNHTCRWKAEDLISYHTNLEELNLKMNPSFFIQEKLHLSKFPLIRHNIAETAPVETRVRTYSIKFISDV